MEKRKRGRERDEIEEKINKKKSVTTLDAGKVNLMERPTPIKCEKKLFFNVFFLMCCPCKKKYGSSSQKNLRGGKNCQNPFRVILRLKISAGGHYA